MKKNLYSNVLTGLLVGFVVLVSSAAVDAQGRYTSRYSKRDVSNIVSDLERSSNTFRRDFDRYLDQSPINGTREEDRLNSVVVNYENSLNRLRRDFDSTDIWWESRRNVQDVMQNARPVNVMMTSLSFARRLETQWRNMRRDINRLADTYDLPDLSGGGGGNTDPGWGGGRINPPSWAVGTFYGTDPAGRRVTLTISGNGDVSANTDGVPFNGSFIRGNSLSFADGTSRVTRQGNGFWTTRSGSGERTLFSSGSGEGGWNGGGAQINPPSWAVGTFYGTDPAGRRVTLTISRNGNVSADTDGVPFNGSFIRGNSLSFADGTSKVTRQGNGFWTTRSSNGERTLFRR